MNCLLAMLLASLLDAGLVSESTVDVYVGEMQAMSNTCDADLGGDRGGDSGSDAGRTGERAGGRTSGERGGTDKAPVSTDPSLHDRGRSERRAIG